MSAPVCSTCGASCCCEGEEGPCWGVVEVPCGGCPSALWLHFCEGHVGVEYFPDPSEPES